MTIKLRVVYPVVEVKMTCLIAGFREQDIGRNRKLSHLFIVVHRRHRVYTVVYNVSKNMTVLFARTPGHGRT